MQAESGWELQTVVAVIVSGRHISAAVTGREIHNIGDIWRWPSVSMESTWTGSTTWLRAWFGLNSLKCFSAGIRERDPRLVYEPYGRQEELHGSIHGFPELILLTQIYANWNENTPSQDPNQVLAGPCKNSASNKGLSLLESNHLLGLHVRHVDQERSTYWHTKHLYRGHTYVFIYRCCTSGEYIKSDSI